MKHLSGKTVNGTGALPGRDPGIADQLGADPDRVSITARNEMSLQEPGVTPGSPVCALRVTGTADDLADPHDMIAQALQVLGGVDLRANHTGIKSRY